MTTSIYAQEVAWAARGGPPETRRTLTSYTKVQAVIGAAIRNRWRMTGPVSYLNVGCGDQPIVSRRWANLDYHWRPGVQLCWDLTRDPLPIAGGRLRGVYSEHCLEHLPRVAAERTLREFARVLQPGGRVRIVVPDAELYCRRYVAALDGEAVRFPDDATHVGWSPIEEVNRTFRNYGHQYAYDFALLQKLLKEAGFRDVERCSYGGGKDPELLVDSASRREESLYVEAVR